MFILVGLDFLCAKCPENAFSLATDIQGRQESEFKAGGRLSKLSTYNYSCIRLTVPCTVWCFGVQSVIH